MSRIALAGIVLFGLASHAHAGNLPPCRPDKLSGSNGIQLSTTSGLAYQAFPGPGSQAAMSNWLPLDRLNICPIGGDAYQITNLSRKSSIKSFRIYPNNAGQI